MRRSSSTIKTRTAPPPGKPVTAKLERNGHRARAIPLGDRHLFQEFCRNYATLPEIRQTLAGPASALQREPITQSLAHSPGSRRCRAPEAATYTGGFIRA